VVICKYLLIKNYHHQMQNTQELSPYKVSTETLADHVGETDKLASHAQKEKHISVG
jgi:hypothetical protein